MDLPELWADDADAPAAEVPALAAGDEDGAEEDKGVDEDEVDEAADDDAGGGGDVDDDDDVPPLATAACLRPLPLEDVPLVPLRALRNAGRAL